MEDKPTSQEIEYTIEQLVQKFSNLDRVAIVVSYLYQNLVAKIDQKNEKQMQPTTLQPKKTLIFEKKDYKVLPSKVLAEQEDQTFTLHVIPLYPSCRNQMDLILHYEKKIAAQTFIKRGYSLQHCKDEIQRRGGLFQMTQIRYKMMATAFVTQAYQRLQKFLEDIGIQIIKAHKVQSIALYSILLNCRKYFNEKEQQVFLNFIALLYEQQIDSVQISKKAAVLFYQKSKDLVKQKLQKGRGLSLSGSGHTVTPGMRLNDSMNSNIQKKQFKSQKDIFDDSIINYYIQTQSISQTKAKFEKLHGSLSQYETHRHIQNVLSRLIRKTLRNIEEYCKKNCNVLPALSVINKHSINLILGSGEGASLRIKILLLSLVFKKKTQVQSEGMVRSLQMWQLQPNRLSQSNLAHLVDLIKEINKYLESKVGYTNLYRQEDKSKNVVSLHSSQEDVESENHSSRKRKMMSFNNSNYNIWETSSVQEIIDP